LKAVIVTATFRPRMKGDTLEYNTSAIRLRANANVEELLGRLPGLRIDNEGNITYNGEKIQRLLVDGEDIFGNNPTLVTRNFDASKIARIQVLDRKSDRVLLTGVDDGVRTKTLNLVMKESEKDGYFGKVETGGNVNGYYNSAGALAAFKNKEQFTALGLAANTGILGFTNNSGGTSNGVNSQDIAVDPLGATAGNGIPQFAGGALHYANAWNGAEDHFTGNYQYSHYHTEPITTIQTLQLDPGRVYSQMQLNRSINQKDQHWAVGAYDWAPSKAGAFRFSFHVSNATGQNEFYSAGSSTANDTLVNASQRRIQDKLTQQNFGGEVFWRTAFHLPGRTFAVSLSINKADNSAEGYLYSVNSFFQSFGALESRDTTDQRKQISNRPLTLSGGLSYTEPLWKGALLGASYGVSVIDDHSLQATFSRGDGKYSEMVDSLSNYLGMQTVTQRGFLNLQGNMRQLIYTLGLDWIAYGYRQRDLLADSALRQHNNTWAPRMMINFTPNAATNFRFLYTATTQPPAPGQLESVKNNTDPLHLTVGNPGLRPAFTQNFHLNIRRLKTWIINLGLDFNLTNNSISSRTIIDTLGRQITQPVNVDGGRMAGINLGLNRTVLGFDAGFRAFGNYSRTVNYVNVDLSRNNTYITGGGISLNRNVPEKYLLQLSTNFTYFHQMSSVNATAPVHYWTQNHSGALTIFLFHICEIKTTAVYNQQQHSNAFEGSAAVFLLNASVSRNFLQHRLVINAQWNNILDRNLGISRSNVNNTITENSSNILGRYCMLSAIYHFDKKFKQK
jgi:outer membrane receptor protein involved in Fe transport